MPKGVITSYKVNGNIYGSYILGTKISALKRAVKKRGLGETIDSKVMEITCLFPDYSKMPLRAVKNKLPELIHASCFLSHIAINSKNISVNKVLGDEGILHQLAHYFTDTNKKPLTCIRDLVADLQVRSTGLYEPV